MPLSRSQTEFRAAGETVRGFVGGVGSGKSFVLCLDLFLRAQPKRLYLCTAPTYPMLRDATLRSFFDVCERLGVVVKYHRTEHRAELPNGAEVLFRSTDNPDSLRGPNLSGAAMDEASLSPPDAYTVILGRLRQGGDLGWMSAAFTPQGLTHWTYDIFGPQRQAGTRTVHARSDDNPYLSEAFVAELTARYGAGTSRERQEIGGEFLAMDGAEWPADYFDRADFWFDEWPEQLEVKTLALDPSKGSDSKGGDYQAYVLYGRDVRGTEYVEADLRKCDAEVLVDAGVEHCLAFKPDGFAIEANAFQFLLAPLFRAAAERRGVAWQMPPVHLLDNTTAKVVRIRRLTEPLHRRCIRFRNTPGTRLLVQQCRDFPLGAHDDGPDSCEMARRLAIDLHNDKVNR